MKNQEKLTDDKLPGHTVYEYLKSAYFYVMYERYKLMIERKRLETLIEKLEKNKEKELRRQIKELEEDIKSPFIYDKLDLHNINNHYGKTNIVLKRLETLIIEMNPEFEEYLYNGLYPYVEMCIRNGDIEHGVSNYIKRFEE